MGGAHKKNKRGSIPSSSSTLQTSSDVSSASSVSPKIELIERTPENDYGVMSDPDENAPTTPVPLLTKEQDQEQEEEQKHETALYTTVRCSSVLEFQPQPEPQNDDNIHSQTEPLPMSNSLQQTPSSLQPLLQEQPQSLQPQITQIRTSKSSRNT